MNFRSKKNMFNFLNKDRMNQVYKAQDEIQKKWGNLPEIVGTGISKDDKGYAIEIHLIRPLPDNPIPKTINDVPIHIDVVGDICAY